MKQLFVLVFVCCGFAAIASQASAGSPTVTIDQALVIAQKGTSGLTLIYGRFETGIIWGFYFITPEGYIIEKEISGTTGKVLKDKVVPDIKNKIIKKVDDKVVTLVQSKALTKMPMSRLFEIAQENGVTPPNSFDVKAQGNQLLVTITGPNGTSIVLDMVTGQVVSSN